ESDDVRQGNAAMPYEFSLGQPLADMPVIRAAILLLRWVAQPLAETEISWLLLSGFVAGTAASGFAVARHDASQRRRSLLIPERTLAEYLPALAGKPDLRSVWEHLGAVQQSAEANHFRDQPRHASAWTELAQHVLGKAAWPGDRPLSSFEFQAVQRWERLLDEVAALDFDDSQYAYADFLKMLETYASEAVFAAESHDPQVQFTGPLESSGQQFDAIWFMGADDVAWPQRGHLHPLLPPSVQRQFGMPSVTPDDDWNLAHRVTGRLLRSAPQVVFSYAEREKEGELRPSPLIAALFADEARSVDPDCAEPHVANLEPVPDLQNLPWPQDQNAGGAGVLRSQSACPFQAFAVRRLGAEPLECAEWGLDPAEKGSVLHKVLERLFREHIHGHTDLVQLLDANRIGTLLDAAIDTELARYTMDDPWPAAYLDAERRRLRVRIVDWLACEAKRFPFTVEECERKLPDVHVGDLRMSLRADRIDMLEDGSRVILDYKSGEVSAAMWKGDRPDEPQLPLYAAFGNVESVSGVLLARIRAGKTGFDGRMRDARAQLVPDLSSQTGIVQEPYTEAMRAEWARVLQNLAAQFLRGEAAVDPREPAVCQQCRLQSLCRVAEIRLIAAAENGDGDDA
ncbi:MAG TPA: PD-(D/E)XK nuclease family protein, partial [Acidobacteriaceae bacterium]|nr:PD-(D/E)XK nuclease family protein [Acidobacteriaceae bacterium]